MKKAFNIAANVCAILVMSIVFVCTLTSASDIWAHYSTYYDACTKETLNTLNAFAVLELLSAIVALLALTSSVVALICKTINRVIGKITIIVIAISGILCIIGYALISFASKSPIYGVSFGSSFFGLTMICLIPVTLEIFALNLKDVPTCIETAPEPQKVTHEAETSTNKTRSTDDKIAELNHLRELHALTQEQYDAAISALIDELKK